VLDRCGGQVTRDAECFRRGGRGGGRLFSAVDGVDIHNVVCAMHERDAGHHARAGSARDRRVDTLAEHAYVVGGDRGVVLGDGCVEADADGTVHNRTDHVGRGVASAVLAGRAVRGGFDLLCNLYGADSSSQGGDNGDSLHEWAS